MRQKAFSQLAERGVHLSRLQEGVAAGRAREAALEAGALERRERRNDERPSEEEQEAGHQRERDRKQDERDDHDRHHAAMAATLGQPTRPDKGL